MKRFKSSFLIKKITFVNSGATMANTKSAKKAIKKITRNTIANKVYKTRIKTTEKKFLTAVNSTEVVEKSEIELLLNAYYKRLDLAVKKNIIHKNKAARKKSQMAKKLATLGQ